MDGADTAGGYKRVVPERFSEERDDLLMESIIEKYAREIKVQGKLTGVMMLNLDDAKALAAEVLGSHKGLDGPAKAEYLKTYFPRTWAHFDVNKAGMIGVESMPQFMRFLASDQNLSLGESG